MSGYDLHEKAADIVNDSGGRLVGRTRLQKITYLSQLAGFTGDFPFEYRHYGPYSEELAEAIEIASGLGLVKEEEHRTNWGGWYSVYHTNRPEVQGVSQSSSRAQFLEAAAKFGAIELELAATAAFLYDKEGVGKDNNNDPWQRTALLKPEKCSDDRLERAKIAYKQLLKIATPARLPPIA